MHCYFVLAGDATIPVLYHVERVREGRSFATRTVQARQRGRCIFTTTLSFMRAGSGGEETVDHAAPLPGGVSEWLDEQIGSGADSENGGGGDPAAETESEGASPFEARRMETLNNEHDLPAVKRTRQWMRCRGTISPGAGHQPHLSALAYMSDSNFIGTVARVHNLWRFHRPSPNPSTTVTGGADATKAAQAGTNSSNEKKSSAKQQSSAAKAAALSKSMTNEDHRPRLAQLEAKENARADHFKTIGMMVSLDHSIYFHRPQSIRSDEWLFSQMESPWAGDGRGLVMQKIWNRRGELVATCVQEGLVRLVQGREKLKL